MLMDYPVKFDGIEVMQWSKWSEERHVVENSYETEAGIDQLDVIRYGKLTIDCGFRCHDEWLRTFAEFSQHDQIEVSSYDIHEGTSTIKIMRMRDFKVSPIEHSEKLDGTNGVWDVSFKLEEY